MKQPDELATILRARVQGRNRTQLLELRQTGQETELALT